MTEIQRKSTDDKPNTGKNIEEKLSQVPVPAPKKGMPELTEKQKRFCEEYIKNGFNALKAARAAGYSHADSIYWRVLKSAAVRAALKEMIEPVLRANGISREKVLSELREHASVNLGDILEVQDDGSVKLKPDFGGKGKHIRRFTYKKGGVVSVELTDPIKAAELISRLEGWETPKEVNVKVGPDAQAIAEFEEAQRRAHAGLIDTVVVDVDVIESSDNAEEENTEDTEEET